jgi:hypothetical protein
MKSKLGIAMLALLMVFSLTNLSSAAITKTVDAQVVIPLTTDFNVSVSKVVGDTWTDAFSMDFGELVYNSAWGRYTSDCYYVIDVGVMDNSGLAWTISHNRSSIALNATNNLDSNINVRFITTGGTSAERTLAYVSYANSNAISIPKSTFLPGEWLRIFYGIASDTGNAIGVEPIYLNKLQGTYTGTVTLTLLP